MALHRLRFLLVILIPAACDSSRDVSRAEDTLVEPQPEEPLSGLPDPAATEVDDPCDGFDNDVDGLVDESCYCERGDEQTCYPTEPSVVFAVGVCRAGIQSCERVSGDFQLGTWGPCVGAVLPAEEICDNGIDEDCSGDDLPCTPAVGGGDPPSEID